MGDSLYAKQGAPMREPVQITLKRCAKTFDNGARALEPLDLAIQPGETLVLLGPSGCGKTTTLRLIAGLEYPDVGGEIWFAAENVTPLPIEKRGVGMVFQSYALFPNMTVGENIAYGLKIRKIHAAARAKKVAELIELVHLEGLAERRINQLSGGQKQRVALARALAVEPRVLLLDEPLTALDAKLRETLRVDINRLLRGLAITSVYVTHDQGEAMALGDRIVVMEHGRIAQIGTPQEIYYRPANDFVAEFIGTMNRLSGTRRDGWLEVAGGRLPLNGVGDGSATIMFRPEDIEVVDAEHHLKGKVVSAFFLGDHTRLIIDTGADKPVIVETTQRRTWRADDVVHLRVNTEALQLIPQ
jgi:putative spermidine/putrescine transport system ATP-binding protein